MHALDSMRRSGANDRSIGGRRRTILRLAMVWSGVAIATLAALQDASAISPESKLEGVWRVTRHRVDCGTQQEMSSFPAIMTFGSDGTVTGYGVPPGSSPALGSPDYGTWERVRSAQQRFDFRLLSYGYDTSGTFSGSIEVTGKLSLNESGDAFTYTASVRFLDSAGGVQFTACGGAQGTRF